MRTLVQEMEMESREMGTGEAVTPCLIQAKAAEGSKAVRDSRVAGQTEQEKRPGGKSRLWTSGCFLLRRQMRERRESEEQGMRSQSQDESGTIRHFAPSCHLSCSPSLRQPFIHASPHPPPDPYTHQSRDLLSSAMTPIRWRVTGTKVSPHLSRRC